MPVSKDIGFLLDSRKDLDIEVRAYAGQGQGDANDIGLTPTQALSRTAWHVADNFDQLRHALLING